MEHKTIVLNERGEAVIEVRQNLSYDTVIHKLKKQKLSGEFLLIYKYNDVEVERKRFALSVFA